MRRVIYLDCNASHPLLPSVREGLSRAILEDDPALSNPASIHLRGQAAKRNIAELREALCRFLGRGDGDEFILLSGATEALNLAIRGFCEERCAAGRTPVLITTGVEHKAILDTTACLGAADSTILEVDEHGQISSEKLLALLDEKLSVETNDVLISLQVANNETGVAFDVDEVFAEIHKRYGPKPLKHLPKVKGGKYPESPRRVWISLDAAQALGKLDTARLRRAMHWADYAAFSAHKIGGPPGVGALWVRPKSPFKAQMTGGSQERKRRAGTLNTIGAFGFKLALQAWMKEGEAWRAHMAKLRDLFLNELRELNGVHVHGRSSDGALPALPNTVNLRIEGCPEESLLLALDLEGYCLSSGSACNSGSLGASHVLAAMGVPEDCALSALRISFGVETTTEEVLQFAECLRNKVLYIREARRKSAELLPDLQTSGGSR